METIDVRLELVAALERRGKTRQAGDLVEFCCPRHEDKNPSAWLGERRWGCHACGFEERLDTLCAEVGVAPIRYGFTLEDYADLKCFSAENLRRWGVETGRTSKFDNDLVAIPYRDANGKTLRIKFRKASGTFWDPDHGKGLRYLYGLDMLAKYDTAVYLVEGESDCHAAWHHKTLAIGVPGANAWKPEWKHLLANREVYVWQEPGEAGAKFAALVCRDLPNAKVIRGTNGTNDLADLHKAVGGNFGAELDKLMVTASKYTAPPVEKPSANGDRASVVTCLADVEPETVTWLWQGRIPRGKITLLEGDPDQGKTTLALDISARVSTGRAMPDGAPTEPGAVLFLTGEDGLADTIRPRLDAMGGDPSRVYSLAIREPDGFTHGVTIPDDLPYLRDVIQDHGIVLVVVDPLTAFLANYVDTHKDHGIRRALAPLAQLAEDTGAAVVCIRHLNKSNQGKALYRGGGSIAFAAAARSVLLVAEDPEDDTYRVLAPVKHNLTAPPKSLRFHLTADLDGATRVIWDGESSHTANALVAQPTDPEERTAARELADFLKDLLKGAPRTVKEAMKGARDAGYDTSSSTLQRARRRIGAVVRRSGFGGECVWSLPAHSGHMVVNHGGVTSKEAGAIESPAKTPGSHSGDPIVVTDPLTSTEEAENAPGASPIAGRPSATDADPDDQEVLRMVRQYARDHPGCGREDAIGYLSSCVSRAKSELAVRRGPCGERAPLAGTWRRGSLVIDPGRLARAIWLDCRPVGLGGFMVRGGKDDHIVDVDAVYVRCDCVDSQLNGDGCKHALCVRLHHGDPEVVEGLRTLVPPPHRSRAIGRRS